MHTCGFAASLNDWVSRPTVSSRRQTKLLARVDLAPAVLYAATPPKPVSRLPRPKPPSRSACSSRVKPASSPEPSLSTPAGLPAGSCPEGETVTAGCCNADEGGGSDDEDGPRGPGSLPLDQGDEDNFILLDASAPQTEASSAEE